MASSTPITASLPSRGSQHLPRHHAYHEPDGKRHLAKDVGAVGGDRLDTGTPQDGVKPGLIHSVEIHTQVRHGVVPARRQSEMSVPPQTSDPHGIIESQNSTS